MSGSYRDKTISKQSMPTKGQYILILFDRHNRNNIVFQSTEAEIDLFEIYALFMTSLMIVLKIHSCIIDYNWTGWIML